MTQVKGRRTSARFPNQFHTLLRKGATDRIIIPLADKPIHDTDGHLVKTQTGPNRARRLVAELNELRSCYRKENDPRRLVAERCMVRIEANKVIIEPHGMDFIAELNAAGIHDEAPLPMGGPEVEPNALADYEILEPDEET